MHQSIYVPESTEHRPTYAELGRRQTVQYAVALLARWLHGHTEKEIAESVGITEVGVRRDLEWALDLIDRRRGGEPVEEMPFIDQMPAAVCSQCNDAIPSGEYRVAIIAAACANRQDGLDYSEVIEAERTLVFCGDCAMTMPQFVIVNDFKHDMEIAAIRSALPAEPGEDALDNGRSTTGHGGEGAAAPNLEYNPKALPEGAAPTARRSMESVRRETLRNFLGDWTRSRGKMPPRMRQAATLYAEGKSQSEIAGELGIDQATVSRMLTGALKSANAAR